MITDADETLLWCQFSFGVQSTQVGSRYMSESFGERDTEACQVSASDKCRVARTRVRKVVEIGPRIDSDV